MILREIEFGLNYFEFDKHPEAQNFGLRSRSLLNFIDKRLRREKFKTESIQKIVFEFTHDCNKKTIYLNTSNVLVVDVFFDLNDYINKSVDELNEYFICLLLKGIKLCSHMIPGIETAIVNKIDEFRSLNYKNEWIHQRKRINKTKYFARLRCDLTISRFLLYFEIEIKKKIIYSRLIGSEKQSEYIYSPILGSFTIDESNNLVVRDGYYFGSIIYSENLSEVLSEN